tara:strand:- start:458 stop:673 length:216 start_codon:yes stop_codon:yes gene_type:complete
MTTSKGGLTIQALQGLTKRARGQAAGLTTQTAGETSRPLKPQTKLSPLVSIMVGTSKAQGITVSTLTAQFI